MKKITTGVVLAAFVLFNIFSVFPASVARADDISIMSVSAIPNSGTVNVGEVLELRFVQPDHMTDITVGGACTVNGVSVNNFENLGDGEYRIRYTVASGDTSREAGQVPFSCALTNAAAQQYTLMAFTDNNTVAINATGSNNGGNNNGGNDQGTTTATTTDNNNNGGNNNNGNNNNNSNTASSTTNGTINGNVEGSNNNNGANPGVLTVTSIEQLNTTAQAGGGFEHGWKWVFHVTVPDTETTLQLKFDDWTHSNGVTKLMTANNVRVSSPQTTGGSAIATAAGVYTAPLTVNGDLNGSMPGRQIDVIVEVQVPSSAVNGSYSTNYFVKTTPTP